MAALKETTSTSSKSLLCGVVEGELVAEILGGRKPKQLENLGGDDPVLVRKHVNWT